MATDTGRTAPGPVGYLVNHTSGLAGTHGIGYDYVLGSGGVYVQSRSAHLTARVLVAPGAVRGLAPVAEKVELTHGPIPSALFELGLRWFQDDPDTERFFAVRLGRGRLPAGGAPAAWDRNEARLRATRWGGRRVPLPRDLPAFFSATDDRDEQGFRIYGVVGRLDDPTPELSLRVGVYGHFAPVDWPQVFDGPDPGLRLIDEDTGSNLTVQGGE